MKTAAVSVLKASLSEYLARVKSGEEVIVTDRGRPIAKIVPVSRTSVGLDGRLLALEKAGLAKAPHETFPEDFWEGIPKVEDKEARALGHILEKRREGR